MRVAKHIAFWSVLVLLLAGCNLFPGKQGDTGGPRLPTAPLDGEGYGQVEVLAVISGDFLPSPAGVAVGTSGEIYVSDDARQRILVFSPDDLTAPVGQIGGRGTEAGQFFHPREIVVDSEGNLYVLDDGNQRIQKLSADGQPLAVFGQSEDFESYFSLEDDYDEPLSALAVDSEGHVYVGISGAYYDIAAHGLAKFSPDGDKLWEIQSTLEGDIDVLPFAWPGGLAAASDGTLYMVHGANGMGKVLALKESAGQPTKEGARDFAPMGKGAGELMHTPGAVLILSGNELLVADTYNNRLQIFFTDGTPEAMYRLQGLSTEEFDRPSALAMAPDGSVFVVDSGNKRVLQLRLFLPEMEAAGGG